MTTTIMHPFMRQVIALVRDIYSNPNVSKNMNKSGEAGMRMDTYDMRRHLRDMGIEILGCGHYSVVVEHDRRPDAVIKIGTDPSDPWLAYAVLCMENAHLSVFPNVYSLHLTKDFYVVDMERLTRDPINGKREDHEWWPGCMDAQWRMFDEFEKRAPEAHSLMMTKLERPTDFRHDNVMYRGTEVVVTDPYGSSSPAIERNRPRTPTLPYEVVSIDEHTLRQPAELSADSGTVTARIQAEGQALRELPKFKPFISTATRQRILSQMRRKARLDAFWPIEPFPVGRVEVPARQEAAKLAVRREQHLHGRRADILIVDDLGAKGEPSPGAKERLRVDVLKAAQERIDPAFVAAWHRHSLRVFAEEATQRRPEPREVFSGEFIPAVLRLPLEDRAGHMAKQYGRQPVQMRRGNR